MFSIVSAFFSHLWLNLFLGTLGRPSTLATSCKELTHWKRLWCWEGLGAGGERDDRGWDGWMASPTRWTWIWVNSGSWWWTGRPGVLWFTGSQRVGHDWATELNWTELRRLWASLVAQMVKNLPSILGLGRSPTEGNGNPLQYSCLENPWSEEPGRLQSMESHRVKHDWATNSSFCLGG